MTIKLKGSSDGSVSLSAPADTSPSGTDITLTLPTDAGSANQFIKNSGTAGTLDYSSMVEDSSGNVSLGTTTVNLPSGSGLQIYDSSTPRLKLANSTTGTASGDGSLLYVSGSDFLIENKENANMRFYTNATERMRIDSSGNVGIGTTSPSTKFVVSNSGAEGLEFSHSSGTSEISSYNRSTSARAPVDLIGKTFKVLTGNPSLSTGLFQDSSGNVGIGKTSASSTTGGMFFVPSGTSEIIASGNNITPLIIGSSDDVTLTLVDFTAGSATPGGSISITSGTSVSYNTSSDYRLKENVVDLDGAIDRVKQLAPKRFNFIADADRTVDGFLAHEAQTVVPEAVTGEKDGEEMQGIDQAKLVPLLTAALKEAIAKIETLETKVAALEAA